MNYHDQKLTELLMHEAAAFVQEVSNKLSLITVTNAKLVDKGKQATIFFTVFPADQEEVGLDFLKRKRADFKEYLKQHARLRIIPFVDFEIDVGEKNRQKIDELSAES